ncbi:MAG: 1-acyl-sn-glycerol-3-phosphate acyltransferase [Crocinitomicaceae bacterium]
MRPLYFLLKILIFYALNLFFKRHRKVNPPKKINAQTIFVVNHASAFMDPWIIAELQKPVLFFLTRGDIFKTWLKPITWAAHMIPIYRTKENGADSAEKNEAIFREVYGLLKRKKSILIFGEGYTDDVFIRSLKPLKKGPARIGFGAMVASNWTADIKIQAAGINYADPNEFRSEVLVSNAAPIHLKDYKKLFLENESKAIVEVTKVVKESLESQLVYLEDAKLTDFHNHIQSLTKKGIAHGESDETIGLEPRWRYARSLAKNINKNYNEDDKNWSNLKQALAKYFEDLKKADIKDQWVLDYGKGKTHSIALRWFLLLMAFPLFMLGCFHHLIPYLFVKRFTEKTFKRRVFWSGIKMLMGYVVFALFNIALCFTINSIFDLVHSGILWAYVILITPFIGLVTYWYVNFFKDTLSIARITENEFKIKLSERENCEQLISNIIN